MDSFKGTPMNDIYKGHGPWNFEIPEIYPSKHHTILYNVPPTLNNPPKPHTSQNTFHWDEGYVRMPYSKHNLFPATDDDGKEILISRWELIRKTLLQPILSSRALEAAINVYNLKIPKFLALHYLCEEVLSEEESEHFFNTLLPGIINLALQLPDILPGSLPLLKADSCKSISLSQLQIASLLANAFLCTFPLKKDMAAHYPSINFSSLFSAYLWPERDSCVIEKIKCLLHYFRKVINKVPVGVITFERQHIHRLYMPRWDRLETNLGNTRIHISCSGTIEDDGLGLLQVDFANKIIGGGVLGWGCVQEEIRFVICPELLISRLFTEKLANNEAVIITGVERFSRYKGYGDTFVWNGDFKDETPFDSSGRRKTSIVAIDATCFTNTSDQFNSSSILREVNKAYAGFHSRFKGALPGIATGNWGCGAFRGDVHLKFLIQMMACSAANRDMVYYTFSDATLKDEIYNMYSFLATNKIMICQLWRLLCRFVHSKLPSTNFFPFIQQAYFDLKKQPSIKDFLEKVLPKQNTISQPSTSTLNSQENISPSSKAQDVTITPSTSSSDSIQEIPITEVEQITEIDEDAMLQSSPILVKRKRIKSCSRSDDLINLINKIDGDEKQHSYKSDVGNTSISFLSCIDDFTKKKVEQKSQIEDSSDEMDVDEFIESLAENTSNLHGKSNLVPKRKITDYFIKS